MLSDQKLNRIFEKLKDRENIIYATALFIITCICFYFYTKDINLKIAWNGFGPHDYVFQKLFPENYSKDFLGTFMAKHYDKSFIMKSYFYAMKYFNIKPGVFIYPFMFMQILLVIIALVFLVQTLFKSKHVTFLSVVIILVSNLSGINMSRFGLGFGSYLTFPLYYGYAFSFSIIGITFSLKNKYLPSFIFLVLSIWTHVTMGFFASIFVFSFFLYRPRDFFKKDFILPFFLFVLMVMFHVLPIISGNSGSSLLSSELWIKSTKMFGCHWYPITMRMFTYVAHHEFIPILLCVVAFILSQRKINILAKQNMKIITGVCACVVMSAIGIFFVEVVSFPIIIKISPQRATGLVSFFGVLFYIHYLCHHFEEKRIVSTIVAAIAIATLFFSKPGIAVLPMLVLSFYDKANNKKGTFFCTIIMAGLLITNLFNEEIMKNIWFPLYHFNVLIPFDFFVRGGTFLIDQKYIWYVIIGVILIALFWTQQVKKRSSTGGVLFLATLSIVVVFILIKPAHNTQNKRDLMKAYMDVQLWAKKYSENDALFIQDPTHSYAWRDFSQRSSFGTWRDWGYVGIVYGSNLELYHEGKKRMKEFGVDLDLITVEEIDAYNSSSYSAIYRSRIRKTFYSMQPLDLLMLCKKYLIDYVVMRKKHLAITHVKNLKNNFKVFYENKEYYVFGKP